MSYNKDRLWKKIKTNKKWIVLGIILLFILNGSFVFRGPIFGKVINEVTNESIQGIKVDRLISLDQTKGPAGSDSYKLEEYTTYTDQNGNFEFGPKIIIKTPLLTWFKEEWLNVNLEMGFQNINPVNKLYYSLGYKGGMASFIRPTEKNRVYSTLKLIPRFDSLDDCKNNSLCIEENSFNLALKNKDETLCLNVDQSRASWDRFQQSMCLSMLGVAKNSSLICNKISDGHRKGICRDYLKREDKITICSHSWDNVRGELCTNLFNN